MVIYKWYTDIYNVYINIYQLLPYNKKVGLLDFMIKNIFIIYKVTLSIYDNDLRI